MKALMSREGNIAI